MIDEPIPFETDLETAEAPPIGPPPWVILVVDDDPEVHSVTRFVLHDLRVWGRPLQLRHAYSAQQAREHPQPLETLPNLPSPTDSRRCHNQQQWAVRFACRHSGTSIRMKSANNLFLTSSNP